VTGGRGPDEDTTRSIKRVLWVTLGLNLVVAAAKIAYGYASGALSIRADGFHSLTDSSNNLVGLIGVAIAARPADADHPYGHKKFEVIAAGLVGLSLLGMAFDVARSAFERLTSVSPPPRIDAGAFVVLVATLAVNVGVSRWERARGEALGSPMLVSDAAHTRADVLVTLGVLTTTALVRLGYSEVDVFAAVFVAGFIAWAGLTVLKANLGYLSDSATLPTGQVERVVCAVPGVASAHKIRTRGMPGTI
jgi:cation diffusion facilitator family transporter